MDGCVVYKYNIKGRRLGSRLVGFARFVFREVVMKREATLTFVLSFLLAIIPLVLVDSTLGQDGLNRPDPIRVFSARN